MSEKIVYTKEYPEELASERVGWTSVSEAPGDMPIVVVNAVAATVGSDGARHGYYECDSRSEQPVTRVYDEGFLAVSGVSILISRENGIDQNDVLSRAEEKRIEKDLSIPGDITGSLSFTPDEEIKQWADSRHEFIDDLKRGLSEHDLAVYYPVIYYLLNGMMQHEHYSTVSHSLNTNPKDLFIPDRAMAKTTEDQVSIADSMVISLEAARREGEQMKKYYTVFSDIPDAEISETLDSLRLTISTLEQGVLEAKTNLLAEGLVYLPSEAKQKIRSWPYSYGHGRTEQEGYGPVLQGLLEQSNGRAGYDLDRELKELERRITYARQGKKVLELLNISENLA